MTSSCRKCFAKVLDYLSTESKVVLDTVKKEALVGYSIPTLAISFKVDGPEVGYAKAFMVEHVLAY